MSQSPEQLPGQGLFGWIGRQLGYVSKAVKTPVVDPSTPKTVYREQIVEEQPHPENPQLKLRRTTIDEVIRDPKAGI